MNIIFDTQSVGIHVFWHLFQAIKNENPELLQSVGFFVTHQDAFLQFSEINKNMIIRFLFLKINLERMGNLITRPKTSKTRSRFYRAMGTQNWRSDIVESRHL